MDKTVEVTFKGNNAYEYANEYSGEVVIPSAIVYNGETYTVVSIGRYAFQECDQLTSVTIPSTVEIIESWAFAYNYGLKALIMESAVPPAIYQASFYDIDRSLPIYVPSGSVDAYKNAPYWNEFTTIVEHGTIVYTYKVVMPTASHGCTRNWASAS